MYFYWMSIQAQNKRHNNRKGTKINVFVGHKGYNWKQEGPVHVNLGQPIGYPSLLP